MSLPFDHVTSNIKGQRGISGDTAVRLGTFFNTAAEFWMNLQKTYELRLAERALPGKVRKHIERSLTPCQSVRTQIRESLALLLAEPHGVTETLFKARPSVWGDLQKAHPKLIALDPSNDGLLDLHGLRLVGKPEPQP